MWKNIQALKNEGYVIEGVNNKGYRLVSEPDVMSEEKISKYLETRTFARKLYYYDETDSTNTRAKIVGETDCVHGALFVANEQTAGKGRRGHSWNSDKGTTISMSYLLKPDIDISCVSRITLVSAVALARAFGKVEGVKPQIKWPNDVLSDGKKLVENGKGCDRSWFIAQVSNEFEKLYDEFIKNKDLGFLVDEYNSYLVNRDKQVYVIEGDKKTEYTALGLSKDGGLLVRDADGEVHDIISGEVSVRGIYGYV